jgi:hypothetical protein
MFILSAFIAVLVPRHDGRVCSNSEWPSLLKMALVWQHSKAGSKLDHFDGNLAMAIWPFPGSSPDLSSSIRCPQMFTDDRLRCARDKHSRVDMQFAGKKLPRHALIYAS